MVKFTRAGQGAHGFAAVPEDKKASGISPLDEETEGSARLQAGAGRKRKKTLSIPIAVVGATVAAITGSRT